jgi:hypothetical protein
LTAARPVGVSLCHQDQAALRPLSSPERTHSVRRGPLESFDSYLQDVFHDHETSDRPPARFVFTKFRSKPPRYDPQDAVYKLVEAFREPERYVRLLTEPGERANVSGGPILLPLDPKLGSRLEGWPNSGRVWPWSRIYTSATQAALLRLIAGMKKELNRG